MRWAGWIGVWTLCLMIAAAPAWAKPRPIDQLPVDVMRWSTMWIEVPQEIGEVNRESGPFVAMTVGPAVGTAKMVQRTSLDLWDAMLPDTRPGMRASTKGRGAAGPVFRYEF